MEGFWGTFGLNRITPVIGTAPVRLHPRAIPGRALEYFESLQLDSDLLKR